MKKYFDNILYLQKRERKSTLMLTGLLLMVVFSDESYFALRKLITSVNVRDDRAAMAGTAASEQITGLQLDTLENEHPDITESLVFLPTQQQKIRKEQKNDSILQQKISLESPTKISEVKEVNYFHFNPNKVDKMLLDSLGIPSFAADNWLKYIKAGGSFKAPDDLNKIYGMDSVITKLLMPYMHFEKAGKKMIAPERASTSLININTASAQELQQIRGIGDVLSARIIKFRDKLGGFYAIDQLSEVYGIQDSIFLSNKDRLTAEGQVKQLLFATATLEELSRHPYCDYHMARILLNFRDQHGPILEAQQLRQIKILENEWLERILPYLKF